MYYKLAGDEYIIGDILLDYFACKQVMDDSFLFLERNERESATMQIKCVTTWPV